MKAKRIITAILAGALFTTAAVSASAVELTELTPDGSTQVTALIEATGEVSYIITIPEKVDFGTLTQPDADVDSYKYVDFDVTATELNFTKGGVSVYAKDSTSTDDQFYLTQQNVENPYTLKYDVYTELLTDVTDKTPVNSETPSENGYHITTFAADAQGRVQDVTLALNQRPLFAVEDMNSVAGEYSGTMTFHSVYNALNG